MIVWLSTVVLISPEDPGSRAGSPENTKTIATEKHCAEEKETPAKEMTTPRRINSDYAARDENLGSRSIEARLEKALRNFPLKIQEGHKLAHIMRHYRPWQKVS